MGLGIYVWAVVKMLVTETDVHAAVVVCRFMWHKENKHTDT